MNPPQSRQRSFAGIARDILARSSGAWLAAVSALSRQPEDPTLVHSARIESRNLLSALATFCPVLSDRKRRQLARAARKLRRGLGRARRLNVRAEQLRLQARRLDGAEQLLFEEISTRVNERMPRETARVKMLLDGFEQEAMSECAACLLRSIDRRTRHLEASERPILLALSNALGDVVMAERQLQGAQAQPLHKLRVAVRHAYFVASCFAPDRCPPLRAQQQALGELHDLHTFIRFLSERGSELEAHGRYRAAHALSLVVARFEARRQARHRAFLGASGGAMAAELLAPIQRSLNESDRVEV